MPAFAAFCNMREPGHDIRDVAINAANARFANLELPLPVVPFTPSQQGDDAPSVVGGTSSAAPRATAAADYGAGNGRGAASRWFSAGKSRWQVTSVI
jgi:hypothetical protein